ncbi:MAG TPA: hypothetical protein VFZ59_10455 [Verrucomicrobiae bacterium]|nr:hypothetical protein [Verrucomicrobiae bacterium]
MRLVFNGHSLPVAQIGPDFILVDESVNHPPTAAYVIFQVDGNERCWPVRLPSGISSNIPRVTIAPIV